jgi:hypothetical protein
MYSLELVATGSGKAKLPEFPISEFGNPNGDIPCT